MAKSFASADGTEPLEDDSEFALLLSAAAVFREHGLTGATLEQVADAAGVPTAVLRRSFPTEDALIQAIFAEVMRRLKAQDGNPWPGYGGGIRRSLAAVRPFAEGYLLLAREAGHHPAYRSAYVNLRDRSARRVRAILWHPERPPLKADRPAMLDLVLQPMTSVAIESIAGWLERGDPAQDDLFIRWYGQMMRAWRHSAAEFLNLDSPEQDWPFDTEGSLP